MICQDMHSLHTPSMPDSGKSPWRAEMKLGSQWTSNRVTCGMLPTLRVLASRGCNGQGSICLVPIDENMDSASHLQMTLLEAYCREIGIEVARVTEKVLRAALGPEHTDLSCVLITNDDPYLLVPPD